LLSAAEGAIGTGVFGVDGFGTSLFTSWSSSGALPVAQSMTLLV
jgi:hypothetical protein